jgi:hypothetical protein
MSLPILPARTPGNRVAQQLDHYDGLTSDGYRFQISESITLKPRGFRLGLGKRTAWSRMPAPDTDLSRRSA